MNDSVLETSIKKIFEDKMAASALDINVDCRNGNVVLSGMVDVLAEKTSAEKIAVSIEGVKKVENNITIATDGYIPDSDIENYVFQKLSNSEDLVNITPKVKGGAVTLIGHVKTFNEEKDAIELAQQARGAKSVTSNIKIESEGKLDNSQITSRISRSLTNNGINTRDMQTTVKNNSVTLNGFVENRYEVELADELISNIEGVAKVKNYLKTRD